MRSAPIPQPLLPSIEYITPRGIMFIYLFHSLFISKKDRKRIYKEAIDDFIYHPPCQRLGLCDYFENQLWKYPELMIIQEYFNLPDNVYWFDPFDRTPRIMILKKALHLCYRPLSIKEIFEGLVLNKKIFELENLKSLL